MKGLSMEEGRIFTMVVFIAIGVIVACIVHVWTLIRRNGILSITKFTTMGIGSISAPHLPVESTL